MNKTAKKVLISLLIILLVLFLLFVVLVISIVESRNEVGRNYINNAPSFCPNTKWVCQEEDIYFTTDARGLVYGVSNINGEHWFQIIFGLEPSEHFYVYDIWPDENGVFRVTYDAIGGNVTYEEGRCTLDYDASQDKTGLFGEAEGRVTRTFLREDLPDPFDPARDLARVKWVCQEQEIWFLSDENGQVYGESLVNGEAVPFRLYCGQAPAYYSAKVLQQDEQEHVTEITAFCGAIWLDEESCFLQYEGGPLLDPLWAGEDGFVILPFRREVLPPVSDWGDPVIRWSCAEKGLQLTFYDNGSGYVDVASDGAKQGIRLFLGPSETRFYAAPALGEDASPVPGVMGALSFDGQRCILQFEAGQSVLFGEEMEGPLTLTFLREPRPKPAQLPSDA